MVSLVTYDIGIAIDGAPTYIVSVPTDLGQEAAERRARWTIIHMRRLDPDRVTVCPAEVVDE